MKELFKEIKDFQEEYFPTSNALSKAKHLEKEVKELIEEAEASGCCSNHDKIRMEIC